MSQTTPHDDADRWPAGERRETASRRSRPTRLWDSLYGLTRRRAGRRSDDRTLYVDRFSLPDVLLMLGIFLLNVFDALFTLIYLSHGGEEANPVMDGLLQVSDWAFLAQKCFVVGLWLVFLTVHKNFKHVRVGLWALLALYTGVLFYHCVLQVYVL